MPKIHKSGSPLAATSDKSVARLERGHQPLLWWILPCLAGVLSAYAWSSFLSGPWLMGGALLGACVASWAAFRDTIRLWQISFCLGVFCFSIVFFQRCFDCLPSHISVPREVRLVFEVTRIFEQNKSMGRTACIGRILDAQGQEALSGRHVYVSMPERVCMPSECLKAVAIIEPLEAVDEGFAQYLRSLGVHERLRCVHNIELVSPARRWERLRQTITRGWEARLQKTWAFERYAALYASMVLGNKTLMDPEMKERLSLSGCLHLFAVSGLHVGIFAGLLLWGLKRIPGGVVVAAAVLFVYVWLTGLAASALRAFVMLSLVWGARGVYRRPHGVSALLVSVFIAFWISPALFLSAGFELSHVVVASFLLVGAPVSSVLQKSLHQGPVWVTQALRALVASMTLSTVATLYSFPLLLLHFQKASGVSLLVNLFAVPLGSLALVLAWCSSWVSPLGLSPVFNTLGCALLALMDTLIVWLMPLTQALTLEYALPAGACLLALCILFGAAVGWGPSGQTQEEG